MDADLVAPRVVALSVVFDIEGSQIIAWEGSAMHYVSF